MRKLLLLITFTLFSAFLLKAEWVKINSDQAAPVSMELVSSNLQTSVIHMSLSGFNLATVQTPQGEAVIPQVDKMYPMLVQGAPALPKVSTSLIIPDQSQMDFEVLSARYMDFENIEIAPSKGNLTRDINPDDVAYEFGRVYQEDQFFPGDLAFMRDPYIVRDYRGQAVVFQPFQYNPVSRVLRVYYDITLKVSESNQNGYNPLVRKSATPKIQKQFQQIYERQFMNASATRYEPVSENGEILVIAYADFMDEMEAWIEWKQKSGYTVTMVDVASIGNSAAIKTYIADFYNDANHDLAFVLLVGDAAQVPSSYSSGDSDNDYAYIVGNDHYPDLFIGRFSAENGDQVSTQVQRTIAYETTPEAGEWWKHTIAIASSQGPGDDNEYDYEHQRNIQADLLDFTYVHNYELFDGSQGGNDAAGSPSPADVATAIEAGGSIITYTGHGSNTSWGSSGFSNTNINQLTNTNKLPFIWSVACVNGNFVGTTCFGEAWMRATDNGEPTGAIAIMASTINQSWDPPMCGQDEMVDILVETYPDNINRTFGAISMHGCMQMNDEYGSGGNEMTDTWVCFGDPTVMVRTDDPATLNVSHNPSLFIGGTQFTVNCAVEGAKVALSIDGTVIGTGVIAGGSAAIDVEAPTNVGTLDVVVTAFNHIPYQGQADIIPAEGPYVVYANNTINDAAGNNNGQLEYGEAIQLSIEITNVGIETAANVDVTLASTSEYVTFTDATENYGDIEPDASVNKADAFAFTVAGNVPDNTVIPFTIVATDGSEEWTSGFNLMAYSANLAYVSNSIADPSGNGNNKLDPGESVDITIAVENNGTADAANVEGVLTSNDPFITIDNGSQNYGDLIAGNAAEKTFGVSALATTPAGHLAEFTVTFSGENNLSAQSTFSVVVGQIPVLIVDLDGANSSAAAMETVLNDMNIGNETVNEVPNNLELYSSVFVLLGTYNANHALTNAEGQLLADYLNQGGNLYMEGGDTWKYNTQTAVHGMFGITGLDDGNGDLGTLNGISSTIAKDLIFNFIGDNAYIDRISASGTGVAIFENESPAYTAAVSNIGSNYKTIGSNFEFGGLEDGENTKAQYMEVILEFFGLGAAPLTAGFYADVTLIKPGTEVQFTDASMGGEITAWSWTFEGGTPATSNEQNPTVTYNTNGTFNVSLEVTADGETNQTVRTDYITVDNTIGFETLDLNETVKCFPNPNNGHFTLQMESQTTQQVNIHVLNALGMMVYESMNVEVSGRYSQSFDMNLENGVYYLMIESENERSIQKMVIRK